MDNAKKIPFLHDNLILRWKDANKKDWLLHVHHDDDPQDPRRDYDPVDTLACFHKRYSLGDDLGEPMTAGQFWTKKLNEHLSPEELMAIIASGHLESFRTGMDGGNDEDVLEDFMDQVETGCYYQAIQALTEKMMVLPIYLYDHSGLTISTRDTYPYNDAFDAGLIGWGILEKEKAISELGATEDDWKEKAVDCIQSSVDAYDKYLRGDAWWYQLKDLDADGEWQDYESCSGFLGSDILECGMADNAGCGLRDALLSGNFRSGTAAATQVTIWHYGFDD